MDDHTQGEMRARNPAFQNIHLQSDSTDGNEKQDPEMSMQLLTEIDFRLAYSTEKLVNLHVLYICILAQENELEAMGADNHFTPTYFFEKALVFDLLSGILDSEVRELDSFSDTLQAEIIDARHKIFSCRDFKELFHVMEEKLLNSEESLKQFQEQFLELKIQSSKLQRTVAAFLPGNCTIDKAIGLPENGELIDIHAKSHAQMVEQQRYILSMLERSLARELDLEKKLVESRSNEELKLKLHYTELVASHMEEATEVVWGRFLEAENASEVLMGISKGLVGCLQVSKLNLNGFIQRENELKSEVLDCMEQLKAKDSAIDELQFSNTEHAKKDDEILTLREKVKFLEEQNKKLENKINILYSENDASREQLFEMENIVESLKESIYEAESRNESAEAKVTQLTETNVELSEEMGFLKGSASEKDKKVGLLEKQVRELEIQLQNARASSEASQEQQNMLYRAIWDMETLIEDLKSKVSKADMKTHSAREQYITLSENNAELKKELDLLRTKSLKTSLNLDNNIKSAQEINMRTKFIMDLLVQLAAERERIQKQVNILKRENNLLYNKLRNTKSYACVNACNHRDSEDNGDIFFSNDSLRNGSCAKTGEAGKEPSENIFQAGG